MLKTRISTATADVTADAVGALCNNGYVRVFGGIQPEDGDDTALESALAVLRFPAVAFRPSIGGVIQSNPLIPDLNTAGTGEPTWSRAYREDGVTPVFDGSVGASGCNINVATNNGAPLVVHPGGEFHVATISYRVARKP